MSDRCGCPCRCQVPVRSGDDTLTWCGQCRENDHQGPGQVLVNGRPAVAWELPAIERAAARDLKRDEGQLAGVLTAEPVPTYEGRLVDDLPVLP